MPPPTQNEIASDWKNRGFSCGLWMDPPGQRWENYVHPVDELVLVLEGDVEFEVDGEIYRPGIGEELFIPAQAAHSVRNIGDRTARWLYGYRQG